MAELETQLHEANKTINELTNQNLQFVSIISEYQENTRSFNITLENLQSKCSFLEERLLISASILEKNKDKFSIADEEYSYVLKFKDDICCQDNSKKDFSTYIALIENKLKITENELNERISRITEVEEELKANQYLVILAERRLKDAEVKLLIAMKDNTSSVEVVDSSVQQSDGRLQRVEQDLKNCRSLIQAKDSRLRDAERSIRDLEEQLKNKDMMKYNHSDGTNSSQQLELKISKLETELQVSEKLLIEANEKIASMEKAIVVRETCIREMDRKLQKNVEEIRFMEEELLDKEAIISANNSLVVEQMAVEEEEERERSMVVDNVNDNVDPICDNDNNNNNDKDIASTAIATAALQEATVRILDLELELDRLRGNLNISRDLIGNKDMAIQEMQARLDEAESRVGVASSLLLREREERQAVLESSLNENDARLKECQEKLLSTRRDLRECKAVLQDKEELIKQLEMMCEQQQQQPLSNSNNNSSSNSNNAFSAGQGGRAIAVNNQSKIGVNEIFQEEIICLQKSLDERDMIIQTKDKLLREADSRVKDVVDRLLSVEVLIETKDFSIREKDVIIQQMEHSMRAYETKTAQLELSCEQKNAHIRSLEQSLQVAGENHRGLSNQMQQMQMQGLDGKNQDNDENNDNDTPVVAVVVDPVQSSSTSSIATTSNEFEMIARRLELDLLESENLLSSSNMALEEMETRLHHSETQRQILQEKLDAAMMTVVEMELKSQSRLQDDQEVAEEEEDVVMIMVEDPKTMGDEVLQTTEVDTDTQIVQESPVVASTTDTDVNGNSNDNSGDEKRVLEEKLLLSEYRIKELEQQTMILINHVNANDDKNQDNDENNNTPVAVVVDPVQSSSTSSIATTSNEFEMIARRLELDLLESESLLSSSNVALEEMETRLHHSETQRQILQEKLDAAMITVTTETVTPTEPASDELTETEQENSTATADMNVNDGGKDNSSGYDRSSVLEEKLLLSETRLKELESVIQHTESQLAHSTSSLEASEARLFSKQARLAEVEILLKSLETSSTSTTSTSICSGNNDTNISNITSNSSVYADVVNGTSVTTIITRENDDNDNDDVEDMAMNRRLETAETRVKELEQQMMMLNLVDSASSSSSPTVEMTVNDNNDNNKDRVSREFEMIVRRLKLDLLESENLLSSSNMALEEMETRLQDSETQRQILQEKLDAAIMTVTTETVTPTEPASDELRETEQENSTATADMNVIAGGKDGGKDNSSGYDRSSVLEEKLLLSETRLKELESVIQHTESQLAHSTSSLEASEARLFSKQARLAEVEILLKSLETTTTGTSAISSGSTDEVSDGSPGTGGGDKLQDTIKRLKTAEKKVKELERSLVQVKMSSLLETEKVLEESEEIQERLSMVEMELGTSNSTIVELNRVNGDLRRELTRIEQEIQPIITALRQELSDVNSQLVIMTDTSSSLEIRLRMSESKSKELDAIISETTAALIEKSGNLKVTEAKLVDRDAHIEDLETCLNNMQEELSVTSANLEETSMKLLETSELLTATSKELEDCLEKIDVLEKECDQHAGLTEENRQLKNAVEETRVHADDLEARMDAIEARAVTSVDRVEVVTSALTLELKDAQDTLFQKGLKLMQTEERVVQLEQELDNSNIKMEELSIVLETLSNELEDYKQDLDDCKWKLDKSEKKLEKNIEESKNVRCAMEDNFHTEKQKLLSQIELFEVKCASSDRITTTLEFELAAKTDELTALMASVTHSEAQILQLEMTLKATEEELADTIQRMRDMDESKNVGSNQLARIKTQLTEKETKLQETEARLKSSRDRMKELELRVIESEHGFEATTDELEQCRDELKQFQHKMSEYEVQLRELLQALKSKEEQLEESNKRLSATGAGDSKQLHQLTDKSAKLQHTIDLLSTRLVESEKTNSALLSQLRESEAELKTARSTERQGSNESINSNGTDNELSVKLNDSEVKIAAQEKEIQSLKTKLEILRKTSWTVGGNPEEEIFDLRNQLDASNKELEQLRIVRGPHDKDGIRIPGMIYVDEREYGLILQNYNIILNELDEVKAELEQERVWRLEAEDVAVSMATKGFKGGRRT